MHTGPMPESAGKFTKEAISERPCRKCGGPVRVHLWESSCGGYEDEKHECTGCGHEFWIEGPDA